MRWRRNLLYHVLPVRHNGTWQRNLDQLKWRLRQFRGYRVVAIATGVAGVELDPPEVVEQYLGRHCCDFLHIPNDAVLREVASWHPLWSAMQAMQDPQDITFYAHAKGVTRPYNAGVTVHPWTQMLYSAMLDFPDAVDRLLERHPIVGCCKKVGQFFQGSLSQWHYSGSFFWVRNRDFFARDWRQIDYTWWGTESFPGRHFRVEEAGSLFGQEYTSLNLYHAAWLTSLLEEYHAWKRQNIIR